MSLLSYTELCELVEAGVITDVPHEHINAASIDVRLGADILVEAPDRGCIVTLRNRDPLRMHQIALQNEHHDDGYVLSPGEFILAHTMEIFNLPDDICAEFKLKSSGARIGLNNVLATWCDAGWHGSALTLELKNENQNHPIKLHAGDRIGQMLFYRVTPVPADRSYRVRGRYNGDAGVQQTKINPEGGQQ